MRNMKIATCLLTITSLVLSACGGGGNDIEKAKSLATTEHLKRYTEPSRMTPAKAVNHSRKGPTVR